MNQITTRRPKISDAERARRKEAVDFARGSVRFEGFVLDEATEALNARYIDGDLTSEELTAEILKLSGVHGD